jgi:hypothetical protein
LTSAAAGKAVKGFLRDAEDAEHLLGLLRDAGTNPLEAAPDNAKKGDNIPTNNAQSRANAGE